MNLVPILVYSIGTIMTAMNEKFPTLLHVLDGKIYEIEVVHSNEDHRESKKKYRKALFSCHQCVDFVNFENVKEAWKLTKKYCAGVDKLKKAQLKTLGRQYRLIYKSEGMVN